jgi:hypothetical protein
MMISMKYKNQQGNALFLILIAVALFAALSYAVTQSGRGGGSVQREQALIAASQMTQFPATVRTAVTRMILTGTGVSDLDFVATTGEAYEVFDAAGGGVIAQSAPSAAVTGSGVVWQYLDAQHATDGWYILNVGSNTHTSGREVIAYLNGVTQAACEQVNVGLGFSATPLEEGATAVNLGAAGGAGAGANAATFKAYPGEPFACTRNGDGAGNYVYFHALVEQ